MTEIEIVARTIYGEARSHDEEDAMAIACVIRNRVGYRNWPNNFTDVCLQPLQFSVWNEGDAGRARMLRAVRGKDEWFDRCYAIAEAVIAGRIDDKTRTATHYHTRAVSPRWSRKKLPCYQTQGHLFFNNIDTPAPKNVAEALSVDRPLAQTRTVAGGVVAAAGAVVASTGILAPDEVQTIAAAANGLGWSGIAAALPHIASLAGVLYMIWARIDDRNKGLR